MSQMPGQPSPVAVYTPPAPTIPPAPRGSRSSRAVIGVIVAVALLIASYVLFPGVAAQAIRGAFPPVHAVITGVQANDTLHTHQSVTFSATQSTGKDLTYEWSFSDGQTASGPTMTRTFDQPTQQMTISLTVFDQLASEGAGQAGGSHRDTTSVTFAVFPSPPTAQFTYSQYFSTEYIFDASGSTSESQIQEYDWDFGDPNSFNSTESDSSPATYHDFSAPGTYTVTLTVKDDYGQTATATQQVTISS